MQEGHNSCPYSLIRHQGPRPRPPTPPTPGWVPDSETLGPCGSSLSRGGPPCCQAALTALPQADPKATVPEVGLLFLGYVR